MFEEDVPDQCLVAFSVLDITRIQAGLLNSGQDIKGAESPWEFGLDFLLTVRRQIF